MNAVSDRTTAIVDEAWVDSTELNDDVSMIAQLAFGRAQRAEGGDGEARHLALLNRETLELDLSDPDQRQFGDYELLELIGEGGMGVVYRAHQHSLDREVAVKLLAAGPWASAHFIERFRREAQNAAHMQHPNIVAIYEVGDNEELHFFSMRLIRGPSLAAEVRREGRLTPMRAARLLCTIAEAVDYAHRLGVLHLDLKPANVLVDENGTPHVADFGLARRLEQGSIENTEVSGTPSYMAPEQALAGAQNITPASDIWGLGAVLYELVTGDPPFLGNSPQATLRMVVESAPPSPRERVPELPRDLEAIILKCMARAQPDRYASARDLAEDLTRFIEGREVRARPLNVAMRAWRWARREPKLAAAAAIAIAALLAGLAATTQQWRRAEANAQQAQQQKRLAEANAQSAERQKELAEARLWEGRRASALRLMQDGKGFDALVPLLANVKEQTRAGKDRPQSIERREIGMIEHLGVTLIDRLIVPEANPMASALSPDGSLLAIALNDITVRWYDTATMTERGRVDLSDLPTTTNTSGVPLLLQFIDDHRLRVTAEWLPTAPSPGYGNTFLVDLDNARAIVPPAAFADLVETIFATDGKHALLRNRRGEIQLWQVDPWRPLSPLRADAVAGTDSYWLLDTKLRYAFRVRAGANILDVFDPRRLAGPKHLVLPTHESLRAWKESNDGTWLALGVANGQVYIASLATLKLRMLPSPTGSEVSWIGFSEDDAWIVAARRDGAAFAFDVASGEPLHSGRMQQEFEISRVEINHRDRLVLVSGEGDSALWKVPEPGPSGRDPYRLLASPTRSARGGPYWIGMSLPKGLLTTADMDGEVRLWRLAPPADPKARPSTLTAASTYFDGHHVVDARYARLRVVSLDDKSSTPWLALPPPIAFAELLGDHKTLLTVARTTMQLFDPATLRPLQPATALRGTPLRLVTDPGATFVALSFPHNGPSGFEEHIEIHDLATGRRRDGEIVVKGPLRVFKLSADGSRLLATGPPNGATEVFDTRTLKRIASFPHDPTRPVIWSAFDTAPSSLWMVTRELDETLADSSGLIHWNIDTGRVIERRDVPGVHPIGITVVGGKPLLAAADRLVLDPGAADQRVAGLHGAEATTRFAASPDGHLVANVFGLNVDLYDAGTLERVGPMLSTGMPLIGSVGKLAFSSDGRSLLGGGQSGDPWWRVWELAPDQRPIARLQESFNLLIPQAAGPRVLRMADSSERRKLRQQDPGPWQTMKPGPPLASTRSITGDPIPARDPGTDPLLLDLTAVYNMAPTSLRGLTNSAMPSLASIPFGRARIDGVDYDCRGAVELRNGAGNSVGTRYTVPLSWHATGIRVPPRPIAAFHVLLFAPSHIATDRERPYAKVRLHYRDGSEAILALRTQREVPGWTDHDQVVPIGWSVDVLNDIGLTRSQIIDNPRLPNPHPERLIASLDLETADDAASTPLFYAVTAEPVIADANNRSQSTGTPEKRPPSAGTTTNKASRRRQ